jgi:PAS domain S-box-containing protein
VRDELTRDAAYAPLLQEDLRDLYEHAPCGYLSTAADGVILKVNQTFCDLAGYQAGELVGVRRWGDLLTFGGRVYLETHFRPLLAMQGFVREIAFDLVRPDGTQIPVLVNASARRADSPGAAATVFRLTVFDATGRRQYERELLAARQKAEEAAQGRNDLIGMVSHDLRAPLSALITAAAMLEKTALSPQQSRYVRVVQSSGMQAISLLNSILTLASLEAGRGLIREREFEPRHLLEHMAAGARLAAAGKPDLRVETTIDETTPAVVVGDPDKLSQVLMNLVGNAVKFTDRGVVSLTLSRYAAAGDRVTLGFSVSDTGIGIPADRLPYIFDEFTQATADIADTYGGTGLGLSISRKLLRLLGSELNVTSTVGQGSTFSFALQYRVPGTP